MSKLEFRCDKGGKRGKRCGRKAYMEVYWKSTTCGEDNTECPFGCTRHWSYLCRWHYYIDRILNFIYIGDNWYADASDGEEDDSINE